MTLFKKIFFIILPFLIFTALYNWGFVDNPFIVNPTYSEHIQPILERSCTPCHREQGSASYYQLDSFAKAKKNRKKMARWIHLGLMPPWLALRQETKYLYDISLSNTEKLWLQRWARRPTLGDVVTKNPQSFDVPGIVELPPKEEMNLKFEMPKPITIKRGQREYLCFYFKNPYKNKKMYMTSNYSSAIRSKYIHHVATFLIDRHRAHTVKSLFSQSEGKGFNCGESEGEFSTSDSSLKIATLGFSRLRENSGIEVLPNQDFLIQVHYDTNMLTEDFIDQTEFYYQMVETVAKPIYIIYFSKEFNKIIIPADLSSTVVKLDTHLLSLIEEHAPGNPTLLSHKQFAVAGVAGHMHGAGKKLQLNLIESQNSRSLLKIDHWNKNYDLTYWLKDLVPISKGAQLSLECIYDNSDSNPYRPLKEGRSYPIVGGIYDENEMCNGVLLITPL